MNDADLRSRALARIKEDKLDPVSAYETGFRDASDGLFFDMTGVKENADAHLQMAYQILVGVVRKFGNFVQEPRCPEDEGGYAVKLRMREDLSFGSLNLRMEQDTERGIIRLVVSNPPPEYRGSLQENESCPRP